MSRYGRNEFVAFSELDGFRVLENRKGQALQAIKDQVDDYILNVNKAECLEHLVSEYSMPPLEIYGDELTVSVEERMIPAEWHPHSYFVDGGQSYPKDVYTFHLPFSGDAQLLKVRASTFSSNIRLRLACYGWSSFGRNGKRSWRASCLPHWNTQR